MLKRKNQSELSNVPRRHGDVAGRLTLVASVALAAYAAVAVGAGSGRAKAPGDDDAVGLALNRAATGDTVRVALQGEVIDFAGWSWTPGPVYYTPATGALQQTGGVPFGVAITPTRLLITDGGVSGIEVSPTTITISRDLSVTGDATFTGQLVASNVDINGGTIDGTTIGMTTVADARFDDVDVLGTLDVTGAMSTTGDLTVGGNLQVLGTTVSFDTDNLVVEDPLFKLAKSNTANILDIGFYGLRKPSSTNLYTGLFRDATDGIWKLFDSLQVEPTTTVNTSGTGYTKAQLQVGYLSATDISVDGGGFGQIFLDDGDASTPALTFGSEIDVGFFWPGVSNQMGLAIGGVQKWTFASDATTIGNNAASGQIVTLNGAAATTRSIFFSTAGSKRWEIVGASNETESGSNAGSNWGLNAYTDAGALIGSVLYIQRASGGPVAVLRPLNMSNSRVYAISNGSASSPGLAFNSGRGFYDDGSDTVMMTDGTRRRFEFRLQASATGLEIGRQDSVAEQSYIDFHSGATTVDYDSRIISSGGTGSIGQGTLQLLAQTVSAARWTQTSSNSENPTISQVITTNGSDNAFRKADLEQVVRQGHAMYRIATQAIATGTNTTTVNLPAGNWEWIEIVIRGLQCGADFAPFLRINGDSTAGNYRYALQSWLTTTGAAGVGGGGTTPGCWNLGSTTALLESTSGVYDTIIRIFEPASTTRRKVGYWNRGTVIAASDGNYYAVMGSGAWLSTAAITSFTLHIQNTAAATISGSGVNATAGTIDVYAAI